MEPRGEGLVEALDRAVLVQEQARKRAGIEHAGQIPGVAGKPQLLDLSLQAVPAQLRVDQTEGAQGRGQVGALGRRRRHVVDQT